MQNQLPNETPGGWLVRVLGAIVSVVIMAALFFLGLTVFAAVAGLALLVFMVLAVRVWWLRRRLRGRAGHNDRAASGEHQRGSGVTLEGEYEERDESRDR